MKRTSIGLILVFFFFSFLNFSCSDSGSTKKTETETTKSPAPDTATKPNDSSTALKAFPVELKWKNDVFRRLYHKPSFNKFRFLKVQYNEREHIRLFCYALDAKEDEEVNRLGEPFLLSLTNDGSKWEDIPAGAKILDDEMAISKTDIDKIMGDVPADFKYIILKPKIIQVEDMNTGRMRDFQTYQVYFDEENANINLNPSPPGFTSFIEKIQSANVKPKDK